MIYKVLGIILFIFGAFFLLKFPALTAHQKSGMTQTGIFTGFIMILLGIVLIILG